MFQKRDYFCCEFLLGLLILNLSFVANVECFLIVASSGLRHALMVSTNRISSYLAYSAFLVITNRDIYGFLIVLSKLCAVKNYQI